MRPDTANRDLLTIKRRMAKRHSIYFLKPKPSDLQRRMEGHSRSPI